LFFSNARFPLPHVPKIIMMASGNQNNVNSEETERPVDVVNLGKVLTTTETSDNTMPMPMSMSMPILRSPRGGSSVAYSSVDGSCETKKSDLKLKVNRLEQRVRCLIKDSVDHNRAEMIDATKNNNLSSAVEERGSEPPGVMEAIMRNLNHLATSIKPVNGEPITPLSNHTGPFIFNAQKLKKHLRKHDKILLRNTYKEHDIHGRILKDVAKNVGRSCVSVSVFDDDAANLAAASFEGSLEAEFGMSSARQEERKNAFAQIGREVHVASVLLPDPYSGHQELRGLLKQSFKTIIDNVRTKSDAEKFIDRIGPFYIQAAFFGANYKMSSSTYSTEEDASYKLNAAMKAHYKRLTTATQDLKTSGLDSWREEKFGAEVHTQACGGDATKLLAGNKYEWSESAKLDPVIVKCELVPIYELAKSTSRSAMNAGKEDKDNFASASVLREDNSTSTTLGEEGSTFAGDDNSTSVVEEGNDNPTLPPRTLLKNAFEKYVDEHGKKLNEWSDCWAPTFVDIKVEIIQMKKLRKMLEEKLRKAEINMDGCFVLRFPFVSSIEQDRNYLIALEGCLYGYENDEREPIPGIIQIIKYANKYANKEKSSFRAILVGMLDKAQVGFEKDGNHYRGPFGRDSTKSNHIYKIMHEVCGIIKNSIMEKEVEKGEEESKKKVANGETENKGVKKKETEIKEMDKEETESKVMVGNQKTESKVSEVYYLMYEIRGIIKNAIKKKETDNGEAESKENVDNGKTEIKAVRFEEAEIKAGDNKETEIKEVKFEEAEIKAGDNKETEIKEVKFEEAEIKAVDNKETEIKKVKFEETEIRALDNKEIEIEQGDNKETESKVNVDNGETENKDAVDEETDALSSSSISVT